jgi:hypothetical protein
LFAAELAAQPNKHDHKYSESPRPLDTGRKRRKGGDANPEFRFGSRRGSGWVGGCGLDQSRLGSHGRYITFQMAEVAVPRQMFQEILSLIARLRAPPAPA